MCKIFDLAANDDRIMLIKYEDLLADAEKELIRLSHFIQIKWDRNMLEHHKFVDNSIDGKINYGKPIIKNNKQKWKNKTSHHFIKRIEEIAYDGIQKLDYEITCAHKRKPLGKMEKNYGALHDIIAMVFVGNREKKNNSIYDRLKEVSRQIKLRTS